MIAFTVETDIDCSPTAAFAYITDPAKLPAWQTNTISAIADDGAPLGLGSRIREVHRAPAGRQLSSLVEVSEFETDRVLALTVVEGALPIDARITLEPQGPGTRLRFDAHGQPKGMVRLVEPLLRLGLRRQFTQDINRLKLTLEDTAG